MVEAVRASLQENVVLEAEIEKVYEVCGDFMQSYDDKTVRIELRCSKIKTCTMTFKFPADEATGVISYPAEACVLEMKSGTMPQKLTQLLGRKVLNHIIALAKEGKE